ncbi:MAG: DotD/TraH family lipoprotein [Bdellovibrionales bacterium]
MQLEPTATEPDLVSLRLAEAAEKAASALDTLSGIEQQREPQLPQPDDYSTAPPALTQLITVRWAGPVEQMLESLADRSGMQFKTVGARASVPVLVTLDVYQKPLIEVLHDLGLQAGRRADITVNSSNNTIEIRYAPVDRM